MNQFTVIANMPSPALYINFGNINSVRLFSELINGDPYQNNVKYLQTATQAFKDRLQLLGKLAWHGAVPLFTAEGSFADLFRKCA